jgi:hypothetical protein
VGQKIGIPRGRGRWCPVAVLEAWLTNSCISDGAIFRPVDRHGRVHDGRLSGEAVGEIVRERVSTAGLEISPASASSSQPSNPTAHLEIRHPGRKRLSVGDIEGSNRRTGPNFLRGAAEPCLLMNLEFHTAGGGNRRSGGQKVGIFEDSFATSRSSIFYAAVVELLSSMIA